MIDQTVEFKDHGYVKIKDHVVYIEVSPATDNKLFVSYWDEGKPEVFVAQEGMVYEATSVLKALEDKGIPT